MVSTAGSAGVPGWYPAAAACVSVDRSRARIGHCNHLHNGRVAAGDGFLRRLYGELRTAPALRGRFGLVVTFGEVRRDRGVGCGDGRVATIVVGSGVPAGPGTPLPGTTMRCALHRAAVRLPPLRHAADPPTSFQPSSALTRCGSGSTVSRPRKTPAPSVARPSRSMVVGDQEEFGDGQSHVLCAPYLPRSPWTDRATSCLMNHGLVLSRSHPTTFRPAASWLVLGSVAALDLRAEGPSALLAQASAAHH